MENAELLLEMGAEADLVEDGGVLAGEPVLQPPGAAFGPAHAALLFLSGNTSTMIFIPEAFRFQKCIF